MTPSEALACIQNADQWDFTRHSLERIGQRGTTKRDVKHAIAHATVCKASETNPEAWLIIGLDRDAEELTVSIKIEIILTGKTRNVIITVF